jgi:hypothetical protein
VCSALLSVDFDRTASAQDTAENLRLCNHCLVACSTCHYRGMWSQEEKQERACIVGGISGGNSRPRSTGTPRTTKSHSYTIAIVHLGTNNGKGSPRVFVSGSLEVPDRTCSSRPRDGIISSSSATLDINLSLRGSSYKILPHRFPMWCRNTAK